MTKDDGPSLPLAIRNANNFYTRGAYDDALLAFQKAFQIDTAGVDLGTHKRANHTLRLLGITHGKRRTFWRRASDLRLHQASRTVEQVLSGDLKGARASFEELLDGAPWTKETVEVWMKAFELLLAAISGDMTEEPERFSARKTVAVSGMGWSGSGAVHDYLKGHPQLYDSGEGLEPPELKAPTGFISFVNGWSDRSDLVEKATKFFFVHLLGLHPMEDAFTHRSLLRPRERTSDPATARPYAEQSLAVVGALAGLLGLAEGDVEGARRELTNLGAGITNNLLGFGAPEEKIPLLDNVVPVELVGMSPYLPSMEILSTFRDPRTNYVALVEENIGYGASVDEFIELYEADRSKFDRELEALRASLEPQDLNVTPVQFENFVVSQTYRKELLRNLGVDPVERQCLKHFRPWESFRNTQLHLDYSNPSHMERIEDRLPEYCVDLTTKPLFD